MYRTSTGVKVKVKVSFRRFPHVSFFQIENHTVTGYCIILTAFRLTAVTCSRPWARSVGGMVILS